MGAHAVRSRQRIPALPDGTRAKLLDSAGQVFADSGYQAATVREICARAGVNIALINYHFGDKLELYTEVLRHRSGLPKTGSSRRRSKAPPHRKRRFGN